MTSVGIDAAGLSLNPGPRETTSLPGPTCQNAPDQSQPAGIAGSVSPLVQVRPPSLVQDSKPPFMGELSAGG